MQALIRKLLFKNKKVKTFLITRLAERDLKEKVFLKTRSFQRDISLQHAMICLDPFCVAAWLPDAELEMLDPAEVRIEFRDGTTLNASILVSLLEVIPTANGNLLLYKITNVKNHQFGSLRRLFLFGYLLRSKKNTYHSRKVISALYSYPRRIILVSYKDEAYFNIFPMDIQGYIEQEGLYLLGLRTTNVTLNKILDAGKVVVCDTDTIDINTVYELGKQPSASPIPEKELPFETNPSELFSFPVPDLCASYKEIEITAHRKMGYHMLMIGKVVNFKTLKPEAFSFYHVGFLQSQKGNYPSVDAIY